MIALEQIRELASTAGFDLCGVAKAEPIPPQTLLDWLEAGMAAEMDWMHRRAAERLDVEKLLPGAKTVIVFATNYYWSAPESDLSPVARYARGRDYHATLRDRLSAFRKGLLKEFQEVKTYASVDSGPLMEKVWAARAGIGYVGRNGCLITEKYGSYVLLAVMVLDCEVDSYGQGPLEDRCGECNLCVTSCPTDAIGDQGQIDARRCLSYQTIENRNLMPLELRPAMADLVFGCDICQEVCPLNYSPVQASHFRFAPRAVASLGVMELAGLTPERYHALIPGTPLARAKYDGLRRNALYALGAARKAEARALMVELSNDPAQIVREAAQWALSRL